MVEIFHGNTSAEHDAFQSWPRAHPNGFHLTHKASLAFTAHWTQDKRENSFGRGCNHQGTSNIAYLDDDGSGYTTAKKVCSDSFQELQDWASAEGVTIKSCAHCDTRKFPFPSVRVGGKANAVTLSTIPSGKKNPASFSGMVVQFARDEHVRGWVLKKAAGVCECCGCTAPFKGVDGQPYLEVHHVRGLADEGTDTVSNTVALCPNCHRQLHHGLDAPDLVNQLYASVGRLVRE